MHKVSEMILAVGDDLLRHVASVEEMQVRLHLVVTAWNMSLYPKEKRKRMMKRFIDAQRPHAPGPDALQALEWEIRRILQQKERLFPTFKERIAFAEALQTDNDKYLVRAYFTSGNEQ